jgi:hypothetical protein
LEWNFIHRGEIEHQAHVMTSLWHPTRRRK